MSKIKVAVIGYGHLGKWHAQKANSIENSELVAIVDPFESSQEKARELYPNVEVVGDINEVMDKIDAAIIVTPTSTHFELTKSLLSNKKHVFCEKPLCPSLKEALDLEPFTSDDLVLQVGHSERCHQIWEELRPKIHTLGSAVTIKIDRVAPFKGRATDVDVVQDLMIHDLDLATYLINQDVLSVKAYGHKIRTGKWDQVIAVVNYSDKSSAIISSGRNHVKEIRSLEVGTDKGLHFVDLMKNEYSFATHDKFESGEFVETKEYPKRDHLLIEQEAFYKSILNKTDSVVDYYDGVKAVRLVQAVIESLESGNAIQL